MLNAKELLAAVERKGVAARKKGVTIQLNTRDILYLRDLNASLQKLVTITIKVFLEGNGIDLEVPHDGEIYATTEDPAKPMSYGDARRLGLVDRRGKPLPEEAGPMNGASL